MSEYYCKLSKAKFAAFAGLSVLSKPLVSSRAPIPAKRISPSASIVTAKLVDILRVAKTGMQYRHLQEITYIAVKASNSAVEQGKWRQAVEEMEKAYLAAWVLGDEVGVSFVGERLACFCFLAGNFDHARRFFAFSQNSLHNAYN